jgi:YVTN family beta-propeller protein
VANARTWIVGIVVVAALAAAAVYVERRVLVPRNVAYVTEEDGGISVIDLKDFKVIRRVHPADVEPRGLALSRDGKFLLTANKDTSDATVFDTRGLRLLKRLHVGDNPEFVKLDSTGQWFFTSFEPSSTGGPPKDTPTPADENEPPSQIVSFHSGDWAPGTAFVAGTETEGIEFSRDGKFIIVANEAQNNLAVYDLAAGKQVQDIDLKPYGFRPRGVKVSPGGDHYAVTMEGSGTLLVLDKDFSVIHSTATAAKPYGVAFDRSGSRIFVSAAVGRKMQVFSSDSLQLLGEAATGQRCWHFTFTPDDSAILLACGRSNNIYVIDASSYKVIRTLDGFHLPWGIVTYPASYGSLGLP